MKLRIWWIPQIPMKPFTQEVPDFRSAKLLLDTLGLYDLFQYDNRIKPDFANAGGLSVLEDDDWVDWSDEITGDGIDDLTYEDCKRLDIGLTPVQPSRFDG